jgi:hypothetical protein
MAEKLNQFGEREGQESGVVPLYRTGDTSSRTTCHLPAGLRSTSDEVHSARECPSGASDSSGSSLVLSEWCKAQSSLSEVDRDTAVPRNDLVEHGSPQYPSPSTLSACIPTDTCALEISPSRLPSLTFLLGREASSCSGSDNRQPVRTRSSGGGISKGTQTEVRRQSTQPVTKKGAPIIDKHLVRLAVHTFEDHDHLRRTTDISDIPYAGTISASDLHALTTSFESKVVQTRQLLRAARSQALEASVEKQQKILVQTRLHELLGGSSSSDASGVANADGDPSSHSSDSEFTRWQFARSSKNRSVPFAERWATADNHPRVSEFEDRCIEQFHQELRFPDRGVCAQPSAGLQGITDPCSPSQIVPYKCFTTCGCCDRTPSVSSGAEDTPDDAVGQFTGRSPRRVREKLWLRARGVPLWPISPHICDYQHLRRRTVPDCPVVPTAVYQRVPGWVSGSLTSKSKRKLRQRGPLRRRANSTVHGWRVQFRLRVTRTSQR